MFPLRINNVNFQQIVTVFEAILPVENEGTSFEGMLQSLHDGVNEKFIHVNCESQLGSWLFFWRTK